MKLGHLTARFGTCYNRREDQLQVTLARALDLSCRALQSSFLGNKASFYLTLFFPLLSSHKTAISLLLSYPILCIPGLLSTPSEQIYALSQELYQMFIYSSGPVFVLLKHFAKHSLKIIKNFSRDSLLLGIWGYY